MDWFFFKLQMCYIFFLLPFLCKIYRNSSILLFQGNVSSRLCFSLFAWLYYSVVVHKKSPECLLWMSLHYIHRRLDVSLIVVTINDECPALIRTVTGGSVCIQIFGSKVLAHTLRLRVFIDCMWVFFNSKSRIINQKVMRCFPMVQ